jgi:hypothetical protein
MLDFMLSQLMFGMVKESALTLKSGKISSLEGNQDDAVEPDPPPCLSSYHCPNEDMPFRFLPEENVMVVSTIQRLAAMREGPEYGSKFVPWQMNDPSAVVSANDVRVVLKSHQITCATHC